MARKPLLLGILVVVLALLAWWFTRIPQADTPAPPTVTFEQPAAAAAPAVELIQPRNAGAEARAATQVESIAKPPTAVAPSPSAYFVRGKVVDARRISAADVEVRLVRADGAASSVRSNARGQFEFAMPARSEKSESVSIWALRGEEIAVKSLNIPGSSPPSSNNFLRHRTVLGDFDAGTLALRTGRRVQVSVVEDGQAAADAQVRIWLGVEPGILWTGTSDATGRVSSPVLPDGLANVEAVRSGATGRKRIFLPAESEAFVELAPCYEAQITLVDKQQGTPIADAVVNLDEYVQAPSTQDNSRGMGFGESIAMRTGAGGRQTTGADGVARFPGLSASADYRIRVRASGFVGYPPPISSGERISTSKSSLRLELDRVLTRTVSWPIEAGEVPLPAEGAIIVLRPAPGSARDRFAEGPAPAREGVVRAGHVVVESIEDTGNFLGTAPDGSIARFWVDKKSESGKPVSFRRPRTIEVSVRDGAGAPVVNALAQARNQGNNALGDGVPTDSEGIARLTGLYGDLAEVKVLGPAVGSREVNAGSVDLEKGDGSLEVVLVDSEMMRARLRLITDGAAQLPSEYELRGGEVVEESAEQGELLVSLPLPAKGDQATLSLSAVGFLPAKASLPVVRDGSEPRALIELVRGATLSALVRQSTQQRAAIEIRTWNGDKQAWEPVRHYFNALRMPNGPGGSFRFFQLAPGRYQVLDGNSQLASDAVDILEGQTEASVELDLELLEWVSGRVELPDAAELPRVRVLRITTGSGGRSIWQPGLEPPEGAYVSADGSFRMSVKRGLETRLRAWHPWLAPAESEGTITVDGAREGVVLRLAEGDQVRIAAPQLAARRYFKAARVALYDGPAKGEPREWLHAPLVDGALRFTGVPRGRATLWIDGGDPLAPLVLADVEIGAGLTDLGTAEFPRGSSLRVKLSVKEGQAAPRIYVSAHREQAPALLRSINSDGETVVVLGGLEKGVYGVHCSAIMDMKKIPDRQIEFDGINDVEIAW